MRNPFPLLALGIALLSLPACSSKSDDPAAKTDPAPSGSSAVTKDSQPVAATLTMGPASATVPGYLSTGQLTTAYGHTVAVSLTPSVGFTLNYWLTGPLPGGTFKSLTVLGGGGSTYRLYTPTPTITGRMVTVNGVAHLFVSGSFVGGTGVQGYENMRVTFTDLQAD
jgi:hypothetical protein